jgi:glutaredoxin 2
MQFAKKVQATWQERSCFIMTVLDPIQPDQERIQEVQRELLEHSPYSQALAYSDVHLFGLLKNTLVANVSLMMKKVKWKCGSGGDNSQNTSMLPILMHR